tara:strand:- start:84 stop:224 length:141 start_codon:yes stop_codon:yes gene_type:complete
VRVLYIDIDGVLADFEAGIKKSEVSSLYKGRPVFFKFLKRNFFYFL